MTVFDRPNGFPIATTVSPIRRSEDEPSLIVGRFDTAPRAFSTARSLSASDPTTSQSSSLPSFVVAMIFDAPGDHVIVRQDDALGVDDDSRAERLGRPRVLTEEELVEDRALAAHGLLRGDVDDGGGDLLDDLDDVAAAGGQRGAGKRRSQRGEDQERDRLFLTRRRTLRQKAAFSGTPLDPALSRRGEKEKAPPERGSKSERRGGQRAWTSDRLLLPLPLPTRS